MAAVYAAHDELLDRPVAVKVLAEHLNSDEAARRRFQREARAAAGLSWHPAVVTTFDVGEHEGRSFIVMERRTGGSIADVLQREGRIDPARAIGWLRDAASALDAAHDAGVVHRDIKPGNLLLDANDRLAVADFGIARLAWEDQVTATGQVLGTASYISPEQAQGDPATAASDRYALAVVAFELLTGSKPFSGEHFAAQARAHIEDTPPPASAMAPLPPAADAVLQRGMAKDPEARWPTATAMVDALAAALEAPEPTATTRRLGAGGAATAGAAAAAAGAAATTGRGGGAARPTGARQAPPEEPRRSYAPMAALVVLLLAGAAVALIVALSGGSDKPARTTPTTATKKPAKKKTATPTPTAAATQTAAPTQAAPTGGDPSALNAQGFTLFKQKRYAEAVPYFQKAVDACGDSTAVDPCAYAMFNLGASLNRSGHPDQAIPILQERLQRWDDQRDTVQRELDAACAAAGQDCGSTTPAGPPGKAKGHKKPKD